MAALYSGVKSSCVATPSVFPRVSMLSPDPSSPEHALGLTGGKWTLSLPTRVTDGDRGWETRVGLAQATPVPGGGSRCLRLSPSRGLTESLDPSPLRVLGPRALSFPRRGSAGAWVRAGCAGWLSTPRPVPGGACAASQAADVAGSPGMSSLRQEALLRPRGDPSPRVCPRGARGAGNGLCQPTCVFSGPARCVGRAGSVICGAFAWNKHVRLRG